LPCLLLLEATPVVSVGAASFLLSLMLLQLLFFWLPVAVRTFVPASRAALLAAAPPLTGGCCRGLGKLSMTGKVTAVSTAAVLEPGAAVVVLATLKEDVGGGNKDGLVVLVSASKGAAATAAVSAAAVSAAALSATVALSETAACFALESPRFSSLTPSPRAAVLSLPPSSSKGGGDVEGESSRRSEAL